MSISPAKFIPREMKTTLIKVYSYNNKCMQGTISNPFFKNEMVFENVMQLITMIERISDSLFFPQKAMELRHFEDPASPQESDAFNFVTTADFTDKLPIATFELEIIFRQNASWQGNIVYAEKGLSSSFRSVLELLSLMDSVLIDK
ncbi:MAG: hypothetical protein IJE27_02045 [Anaerotignum sp.]|nr:hypothetical protein [Anaerotignum sp.]